MFIFFCVVLFLTYKDDFPAHCVFFPFKLHGAITFFTETYQHKIVKDFNILWYKKKGFKPTENHLANNPQKLTEQVIVCENLASVCFIVHSAYKFNN
jgi:hypothetical protein